MGSYSSENRNVFNARGGSSYPFASPYVNRVSYPGGRSEENYSPSVRRTGPSQTPVDFQRDRYFRSVPPNNFRHGGAMNMPVPLLDIDLRHRDPGGMSARGSFDANRSFYSQANHPSIGGTDGGSDGSQRRLFQAPVPWVLPFKTVNVRESFDSASSAHQTPGAWGAQSIRGSSDSLPAYMPSHHHLDADVADIDFSRSPPYKNAQARGGVPQSFDRGNSKPQYRVGRSVRPGVEYSVGASDAALLARDTRNAHTHVHTLERAAGGEGGSGGVVATSRSHKIMFGGAEEPSPMREGINLLAGPEPPSALEGMGDIFGGSRDWYGQRGSQPGQQQPRQPTSTTVRSCAVIQYDNNGTVVEYEGRVRGGTGAPVARLDVFTGTPGGGEAGASSPPTKRYERGLHEEGGASSGSGSGSGSGMRYVENPRASILEYGTGFYQHVDDAGGGSGGKRAEESRYVQSANGVIYGRHQLESESRGVGGAGGGKISYANFHYAMPGEDLGTRFSQNTNTSPGVVRDAGSTQGSSEVSPYYRPGIRDTRFAIPSRYQGLNVGDATTTGHETATTYKRETGALFRDLRSTASKLVTGSPPPKPAARSPRGDASTLQGYGHLNATAGSSPGGGYQPGYAGRHVTYTVVRPEGDAKWDAPPPPSVDSGSQFLGLTHDAIRDALSELITCTHKNRIQEAAAVLDEVCGVIDVHVRQEEAAAAGWMNEADKIAVKADHERDAEEMAGLKALFGSCLMGEGQVDGLVDKVREWAVHHESHLMREEQALSGEIPRGISGRQVITADFQGMEEKLLGQVLKRLDSSSPFKTVFAYVKIVQESCTPAEFMRLQATMWRHLPASTMQRLEDEGALKAGKFVDERQSHDAVNSFVKENLLS